MKIKWGKENVKEITSFDSIVDGRSLDDRFVIRSILNEEYSILYRASLALTNFVSVFLSRVPLRAYPPRNG